MTAYDRRDIDKKSQKVKAKPPTQQKSKVHKPKSKFKIPGLFPDDLSPLFHIFNETPFPSKVQLLKLNFAFISRTCKFS